MGSGADWGFPEVDGDVCSPLRGWAAAAADVEEVDEEEDEDEGGLGFVWSYLRERKYK